MKLDKIPSPPLLPDQWSSSYISYWTPMFDEDQITSGYCWFNYIDNKCRIDGLFNPWSEKETGHRLWMSELVNASNGVTHKKKIAYTKTKQHTEEKKIKLIYNAIPSPHEINDSHELLLAKDVLIKHKATYAGKHKILNIQADSWEFYIPNKGPATYFFKAGTNCLIRMVTGDPKLHASVRDFPTFNTEKISEFIFDLSPYHDAMS
ncbi:violacein biosynthesis enzyme VioE [Zooshikella ganghwensis]|uniref:Violacein biosynthesis enzyme VioE n=1 Tax=Zooshikella ganghwensis TaxID=202772 RepID=A0A4P9VKA7_9GAMM|nr:violacein biosynthesis enzyme VioE [Zooshikella ganghwensis]RDH42580.1 violacein biosynthesis enzyme VioE [Zooshikella ganghwensis]